MKQFRILALFVLLFTALSTFAETVPYFKKDNVYKCTGIYYKDQEMDYDAYLVMSYVDGANKILCLGVNDDDDLDFKFTVKGSFQAYTTNSGKKAYKIYDTDGNVMLVSKLSSGKGTLGFTLGDEAVLVIFDTTPICTVDELMRDYGN